MPGPLTHVAISFRLKDTILKDYSDNWEDFIYGTVFPDIRHLAKIPRDVTHFTVTSISAVLEEKNAFKAGIIFHNFVDIIREKEIRKFKLQDLLNSAHKDTSIKFCEDIYSRDLVKDKVHFLGNLDTSNFEVETYGVTTDQASLWAKIIYDGFNFKDPYVALTNYLSYLIPKENVPIFVDQLRLDMEILRKDNSFNSWIKHFYNDAEVIFS